MSEETQTCFCLAETAVSRQTIGRLREQLPKARARYDKYKGSGLKRELDAIVDLQKIVGRLWEEFPKLIQQLNEYGDQNLIDTTRKLYSVLKRYDYLGTRNYAGLCAALKMYEDMLPVGDTIDTAALGRLMNRVRMGYYPTDLEHVQMIKKAVIFPESAVNILDPCCGEGLALETLADGENAVTYGVELDEVRAEEAQNHLKRIGFGSFFHSRISSGAFQCVFLNPPYLSVVSESGHRRQEKAFLADSMRLLMDGGLLIYIIPYYRATPDVCQVLCENFDNLQVFRFMDKEFERFKQVVFLGVKRPRREEPQKARRLSEFMLSPENLQPLTELPDQAYSLPAVEKPVEMFKGEKFNVMELAVHLKKSKSIDRLFEDRALDNRPRQPLLPLNVSQIGLVGASGMMNGLVECDTPHVIKGRIVKETKTKIGEENDCGKMEIREITSNKLVFNILTPQGYRSLG